MIQIPEDRWGFGPASDDPGTLLSGRPAPIHDGYLFIPADGWGMVQPTPDDDPVTRADSMKDRAQRALDLMQTTTAANRELDTLVTGIVDGPDWREGLSKFDKGVAELRQKHAPRFKHLDEGDAFGRDLDEFAGMRRIGLKRALVEKQQGEALSALDDTLSYYAGEAATAGHDVFREIAVDRGLKAIQAMREAGYLFPESASKLEAAFRGRIEGADLERIVQADPENALAVLNDARLFPNAGEELRAKLIQSLTGEPSPRDDDDIAGMLAPLVENNDGLRELVEGLKENPDDPDTLVQLASNLLDGGDVQPEANRVKLLEQLLRELLRRGGDLIKRRPRDPAGEKPPQLAPPKPGNGEPKPLPPVPPRISRPKADPPIVEPPPQDDEAHDEPRWRKLAPANDRYTSDGPDGLVRFEDGSTEFGRLTTEAAEIARSNGIAHAKEGPIVLQRGFQDSQSPDKGMGAEHIRSNHEKNIRAYRDDYGKQVYRDAEELVADVTANYNRIARGDKGRIVLGIANGKEKIVVVEIAPKGDGYTVITAGIRNKGWLDRPQRSLPWRRTDPSSSPASGLPTSNRGAATENRHDPSDPGGQGK